MYTDTAHGQVQYYIRPLLTVPCHGDPCLTLAQLAADSTSYLSNETNISLSFLPGNHSLDRELSLSHADNFSMTKDTGGNETVFVECGSQSGRFNISDTTFATIRELHFIGCGCNRVSRVEQFIVEDTIFRGVEGRGTALVLNEVTAASIVRSSFLANTHGSTFEQHDISSDTVDQEVLNYVYLNRNPSLAVGGALYTVFSNVSIVGSKFTDNTAEMGGALFAQNNSSLHVVGSTYNNNRASFGGVIITLESSVNIDNSTFTENTAEVHGGVMMTYKDSFSISDTTFTCISAVYFGGVIIASESSFNITSSTFMDNNADYGGVMFTGNSSFNITNSTFTNNAADNGGVMITTNSTFIITSNSFTDNSAAANSGVIGTFDSFFDITNSIFTDNIAADGGVIFIGNSSFNITDSTFTDNIAAYGGVMLTGNSSFNITSSTFTNNAAYDGGVMITINSSFIITSNSFTNNSAANSNGVIGSIYSLFDITNSIFTDNIAAYGGVMIVDNSSFNITTSTFTENIAAYGGVMFTGNSSFNITSSTFTDNSAGVGNIFGIDSSIIITSNSFINNNAAIGGVISVGTSSLNIVGSSFYTNKVDITEGIMLTIDCSTHITDSTFNHNLGSLYVFNSNLTFSGYTSFENGAEPSNEIASAREEGGAITSFQSTVIFAGVINLSKNEARRGGAVLATESKVLIYGEIIIADNAATNGSGGGIYLYQCDLQIKGNCIISGNHAMRGGGIHATSSTVAVYQPGTIEFINNRAESGGGLSVEVNSKLYILKPQKSLSDFDDEHLLIFRDNHATIYGGAIYVADDTNSGACSPGNECFIQTLALHRYYPLLLINILFSNNTASEQGANLFGGLLDRCIPSPFAEVYYKETSPHYSGVEYIGNISNIRALDTISSQPVRICLCDSESEPNCSYQPSIFKVKKGEAFTVPLVAVDQVNYSVDANIISSLSSQDGGFSEGQQTQSVERTCSNVTFNVFSPHDSETINLFADGPCGRSTLSIRHLKIHFTNCTCPVGFEPLDSKTRCDCNCDSELSPHITHCDPTTKSLVRMNTNSWITHINDTDPPGYVIHPNCPLDYCRPPTENVSMNLNLPNGADAQCAYDRNGILCGACQAHLSLSLGSSRCIPCHSHWPAVLVVILLAAIIAGILLVIALLALNMTVAVGLINGFIFYANIVSAVFFPSSEPSFPTVFVAWLNLDIGIDVCFFDGLDAYTKTWLQLAFPVYIIFLVITVIIISEYSPRFARLIGKRDPIATLATLILLSYAKLLSLTITALSFAVLDYPDGLQEAVWLPDGNVKYFQGKHIVLVLVALLIILIGVPYTILLFFWQWLLRAPKWKFFNWTRNTKLNAFISVHYVPYNSKYRYWTGLLLLVRVVLYTTASITVSGDPQTSFLITNVLVGGLFLIKEATGARMYKSLFLNIIETGLYFNILALSSFSWYHFKSDIRKQTAVAYTSTIITFILLVGVIIYHVYLLVRKDQPPEEVNEYPLAPGQVQRAKADVTHSVIEILKPRDQSPPSEAVSDDIKVKELICTATPVYM